MPRKPFGIFSEVSEKVFLQPNLRARVGRRAYGAITDIKLSHNKVGRKWSNIEKKNLTNKLITIPFPFLCNFLSPCFAAGNLIYGDQNFDLWRFA